jgi:peptidyl-prolyl cis-trans isomerase SurA
LNDLIVQDILFAKAKTLNIDVPQADLDTAYTNAKKNITEEAYQQELARRNLTTDDMREGLRRELLTQKVIQQEVSSKVIVTDQEIGGFFTANRAQFNVPEEAYHIAQIVVTPQRDQQITNGTGDDATTQEAANAKVQMLMERLKSGVSFAELAAGYSEDPESAPRGGDIGFVPVSRLQQAPASLRSAVIGKEPGSVNVSSIGGGHTLVLVVAHEMAGQRELTTPGVKERISDTLRGRREQLMRAAYLNALRNDAVVVNYLARKVVDAKGSASGLSAAAPATK